MAACVEQRGVDVVDQVFEQELIAPLACGSLMVPACIGSIAGSAEPSIRDAEVLGIDWSLLFAPASGDGGCLDQQPLFSSDSSVWQAKDQITVDNSAMA